MPTENEIKKEIEALVSEVPELIRLAQKAKDTMIFAGKYQHWYSKSAKVVELLGTDRYAEFCAYYLIDPKRKSYNAGTYVIQDYTQGMGAAQDYLKQPLWDVHNLVSIRVMNQSQILSSLKSRIDSVLADVSGKFLAEIEDEELAVAEKLVRVNLRAAGAVAGVVLEGHLQRVARNHGISLKKNPTISDLNDPLKSANIYDLPVWRKIQHLADLRNLCDHKKDREPTEPEVKELIIGTASIVKSIF